MNPDDTDMDSDRIHMNPDDYDMDPDRIHESGYKRYGLRSCKHRFSSKAIESNWLSQHNTGV